MRSDADSFSSSVDSKVSSMKASRPINWDFVSGTFLRLLRLFQVGLGGALILLIIYISVHKGIETGSTQGMFFWLAVGVLAAGLYGAVFAGIELLLSLIFWLNERLAKWLNKQVDLRRRIITSVSIFLFVVPFALLYMPGFWSIVTDNLLRALIFASLFAGSSALLSIAREEKTRNRIVSLALLESTLSNHVPLLSDEEISAAIRMAEIYVVLHCYENSVRKLVERVLSNELGDGWWTIATSDNMKRSVENRRQVEQTKRWLSPRGGFSPLYYLDWGDLEKLMRKYDLAFLPYIGELRFVESRFGDLECLRNIVAHHGVLPSEDDFQRVKLNFNDWSRQVGEMFKSD